MRLPQHILLTKEVIEAFGLFFGEGTRTQEYNRIEFGNTEPQLLRRFINLLKEFNIKNSEIRVKINIYKEDAEIRSDDELKSLLVKGIGHTFSKFSKNYLVPKKRDKKGSGKIWNSATQGLS